MSCPIPGAWGSLRPEGTGANGVLILGEAMGEEEAKDGLPFRPYAQAGSVLERAIRRAGFNREQFVLWNVVPTHPPKDYLAGAPYEQAAIEWGKEALTQTIRTYKPRVILALGSIATRTTTGLTGPKLAISNLAGYLLPGRIEGVPVVASFHPSYLRRGKMSHFGLLMNCIKYAVRAARNGLVPQEPKPLEPPPGYILHPTEFQAGTFADECEKHNGYIAYDIETAYSVDEETAEETEGAITSIQFSLTKGTGIYLPYQSGFVDVARRILANANPKLNWNGWRFDNPVLRANGFTIGGENLDMMWLWHALQPDLPRGLQFAAGQMGWPFPWKHISGVSKEYYGIVDVDVLMHLI